MRFTIEDLTDANAARIDAIAQLLHTTFSPLGVWTTVAEAKQEVLLIGAIVGALNGLLFSILKLFKR